MRWAQRLSTAPLLASAGLLDRLQRRLETQLSFLLLRHILDLDVQVKAIEILAHHLHGVRAGGLVDAHSACGGTAIAMREHHDLADHFLLSPIVSDPLGADHADAGDLLEVVWCGLDDVEDVPA